MVRGLTLGLGRVFFREEPGVATTCSVNGVPERHASCVCVTQRTLPVGSNG